MIWFLQMAQLSTTISHAQSATAFHFLISNRFGRLVTALELGPALDPSPEGPVVISVSTPDMSNPQ
jgi:hypothetical protein